MSSSGVETYGGSKPAARQISLTRVETEEQSRFLEGHDCREIQGYLIARPLPADVFAEQFLVKRGGEVAAGGDAVARA